MRVPIVEGVQIEVGCRESHIRLCVHPDFKWVPVSHEHPLAEVELTALHDHRCFDILLHDVLGFDLFSDVYDLYKVAEETNAPAARATCWFHDPDVFLTVDAELWELLFQLLHEFGHFFELI